MQLGREILQLPYKADCQKVALHGRSTKQDVACWLFSRTVSKRIPFLKGSYWALVP